MGNAGGGSLGTGNGNAAALAVNGMNDSLVHESTWDEVFPLLDAHFFQLVPAHLYEQFLNHVSHLNRILGRYHSTNGICTCRHRLFLIKTFS